MILKLIETYRNLWKFIVTTNVFIFVLFFGTSSISTAFAAAEENAFIGAAIKGDIQKITSLSRKVNLETKDENGKTALMYALFFGYSSIVNFLLSKGALINATDSDGRTALMYACRAGQKEIVELLLKKGADIRLKDDTGKNALMYASLSYHKTIDEALVPADEDMDITVKEAALIFVRAPSGQKEIVRLLLAEGADVNVKDKKGKTALMLSAQGGKIEIVDALLSRRADLSA